MTNDASDAVEREVHINARPETVFSYFVDETKMLQWKGVEATLDPRSGGIYRVDVTGRDVARGEYVVVDPPRRVVITWGWEGEGQPVPPGASTVEITLTPDGDGTLLRLRHSGLTVDQGHEHLVGWDHYLERLAVRAGGGDPGVDPWTSPQATMQPA